MASVNKVVLIGNVGRDPEVRFTTTGSAVCNIGLATTTKRKDKQSGQVVEETQWHRVCFYEKLAEIAGKYVTKGKLVYIEGRIRYGRFVDKDGIEKHTVEIVASDLQLLSGKDTPQAEQVPALVKPAAKPVEETFDEDIPF